MVAIILMRWTIWLARNEIVFNENQMSIQDCRRIFLKEERMVSLQVKTSLSTLFEQWIQSLEMIWASAFALFYLFPSLYLEVVLSPPSFLQ